MNYLSLLSALKYLATKVESMEAKLDDVRTDLATLREDWNQEFEFEVDSGDESDDESEESDDDSVASAQSAPATFSYKRQRTE